MLRAVLLAVLVLAVPAGAAPRCDATAEQGLATCIAKATKALRRCTNGSCETSVADRFEAKVRRRCDAATIEAAGFPPPADPAVLAARLRRTCLGNAAALVDRARDNSPTDARCADVLAATGATVALGTLRAGETCRRKPERCARLDATLTALERRAARKTRKRCGDDARGAAVAALGREQMTCAIADAVPSVTPCAPTDASALVDLWRLAVARPPGVLAGQMSSYDRTGGNLDFGLGDDSAGFLAILGLPTTFRLDNSFLARDGERFVVFDEVGPGVVWRIWMTGLSSLIGRDLQGDIAFQLDDEPTPRLTLTRKDLFAGTTAPFLAPLAGDAAVSSGGFYAMAPIPFARRLRITTSHVPNWLQVSYTRLPPTQAVASFDPTLDVSAVAARLAQAGDPTMTREPTRTDEAAVSVEVGATQPLWSGTGPGTIVRLAGC